MARAADEGTPFHYYEDQQISGLDTTATLLDERSVPSAGPAFPIQDAELTLTFENFFHPLVGDLITQLNRKSIAETLDPVFLKEKGQPRVSPPDTFFRYFEEYTKPSESDAVRVEGQPKEIDLNVGGAYANYNWELLYHIPLAIAVHLSKNQRFAEAQRWFHYIFDPTCNDTSVSTPARFWKFLGFREGNDAVQIDERLALLSKPDSECSPLERRIKQSIRDGYNAVKEKPFQPHAVARTRPLAYQYYVVMKYLDNLIAWGDSLFRQDTIESINEATQRYVLAANLLGARPQRIPPRGISKSTTFAKLKERLDEVGNALEDLEGRLPLNLGMPRMGGTSTDVAGPLFGIGRALYFCVPRNEKMLSYWDTVADRLFKIRHCMNIEGVVRQLALFDPPLDPAMLVKATAAGINIGSIVSGLNQPVGPVRSLLLIQKALELCAEVRNLGGALLSALEKGDGERIALLRQSHEINIQRMQQEVRFLQWKQAQESTTTLLHGRASALERYRYYLRLVAQTPDENEAPNSFDLDRQELTEANFDEVYGALVKQYERDIPLQSYPDPRLAEEASTSNQSGTSGAGRLYLKLGESAELHDHADRALAARVSATGVEALTATLSLIPDVTLSAAFWGVGGQAKLGGGGALSNLGRALSAGFGIWASIEEWQGQRASKTGSFERRADDWTLQSNLAAHELAQIGRQIIGSLIAEQIARREYENVKQQIEQSVTVDELMRKKFTNEELYVWMQGEISRLYYEYYRFGFDTARKAEQSMKRELMRPEVDATDYIKFNYWDGGRKGLLSGEALYLDLKRMEMAYHENNKREYELTKHVSLRQLNPLALLTLKATGSCEVTLPEWLFDLDAPGHYLRRIKSVSLTIPSVVGPYTSVNCTLTLLRSSLRKSPQLTEGMYARPPGGDDRFVDYFGSVQSIVTSSGNNDSGLFETNLRDERFLPFENSGAVSTWRLELPSDFRQFDYDTISDVILHMRYTARQGGVELRSKAVEHVNTLIGQAETCDLVLLSLKNDFPDSWHRFVSGSTPFTATVTRNHFPYITKGRSININEVHLCSIHEEVLEVATPEGIVPATLTTSLASEQEFELSLPAGGVLARTAAARVFVLIKYSIAAP